MKGTLLEGEALRASLMVCNSLRKRRKEDVQSSKVLVICLVMRKVRWPLS
jgi:hypothetical protein